MRSNRNKVNKLNLTDLSDDLPNSIYKFNKSNLLIKRHISVDERCLSPVHQHDG